MPGINNRHRHMILDLKRDAGKAMLRAERPQHARAAIRRRSRPTIGVRTRFFANERLQGSMSFGLCQ
jgi:hypothetical protein